MINLYNIDCMEYMRTLPDGAYDLAIVDPPYFDGPNILGYYGARKSKVGVFRKGYRKLGQWNVPGREYFQELKRVSKEQIIWGINYYEIQNIGPGRIVWDKCNDASSFSDCEIAYSSQLKHVKIFRYMWSGMLQGKSIAEGAVMQGDKRKNEQRIHPTQKPVALYKWLLSTFAKPGWRILDTHGGSMSIAIAAHDMGFDLDVCEIDAGYFAAAKERLERHQMQQTFDFEVGNENLMR